MEMQTCTFICYMPKNYESVGYKMVEYSTASLYRGERINIFCIGSRKVSHAWLHFLNSLLNKIQRTNNSNKINIRTYALPVNIRGENWTDVFEQHSYPLTQTDS